MATRSSETKSIGPVEDKAATAEETPAVEAGPEVEEGAVVDDGLVEITLAHFYGAHIPGDQLRVTPDVAASLRAAGYVQS